MRELHLMTPLSLRGDSLLEEQQEAAVDVVAVLLLVLLFTAVSNCSYSRDELGNIVDICGGMLFDLTNGRITLVDFTSMLPEDASTEVSDVALHSLGLFGELIDFATSSVALIIETLDVEATVVEVGDDGADGEDAKGVPGSITISGNESIDDFSDWLSK